MAVLPPPPDDEETRHARGCGYLMFGTIFAIVWAIVCAIWFAGHR